MLETCGESPVYEIDNGERYDNHIYVKREDLLPFSLGGNKVRIAREFFQDMRAKGCDTMIAYGNARSNLCRVIANECCIRKIPCYIINSREEYEEESAHTSNSRLMELMGAKIVPCRKDNIARTVENTMENIRSHGGRPYYIFGNKFGTGNEAVAARAYARAYKEISAYEERNQLEFDYIFHASGTGSTQAGLICGHLLAKDKAQIVGILISSREYGRAVSIIREGAVSYLSSIGHEIVTDLSEEIHLEGKYNKGGYGIYDNEILKCMKRAFLYSSLPLDPVYTGKAYWGMQEYLREHKIKGKNILFIHTGGTPLFFDCLNAGELK